MDLLTYYSDLAVAYPEYITQKQFCEVCGICHKTAYNLTRRGEISYEIVDTPTGRIHHIKLTDALAYLYKKDTLYGNDENVNRQIYEVLQAHFSYLPDLLRTQQIRELTGFSMTAIRAKLLELGIPENEIAFIHNAKSEAQKKDLFGKVRSGQVRILLGSTQRMGAGTNCQQKLIALHHLECPWRPSDLQQREGRIIRQGNENPEVDIYSYVTEGTFDAYLYQLVESKQKFISQIMTSKSPVRSAEDVDEQALSYRSHVRVRKCKGGLCAGGNAVHLRHRPKRSCQQCQRFECGRCGWPLQWAVDSGGVPLAHYRLHQNNGEAAQDGVLSLAAE